MADQRIDGERVSFDNTISRHINDTIFVSAEASPQWQTYDIYRELPRVPKPGRQELSPWPSSPFELSQIAASGCAESAILLHSLHPKKFSCEYHG